MNFLFELILESVYLALPAYLADTSPVFAKKLGILKFLDKPIDFGKKIKGQPIFGRNKTFRGFVCGIIVGILIAYLQKYLYQFNFFKSISLLNYSEINLILLGFLLGFGVLIGDLLGSFLKRRAGIGAGGKFFPVDQIDAFVGIIIFLSFIYIPSWEHILCMLIATPVLVILSNLVGYILKIKKVWW